MSPTKVHSNHTLGSVARASLMLFVGDTETKCSTSFPLFKLLIIEFFRHIHYNCEAFILLSLGFEIIMHFEVLRFISTFISVI